MGPVGNSGFVVTPPAGGRAVTGGGSQAGAGKGVDLDFAVLCLGLGDFCGFFSVICILFVFFILFVFWMILYFPFFLKGGSSRFFFRFMHIVGPVESFPISYEP